MRTNDFIKYGLSLLLGVATLTSCIEDDYTSGQGCTRGITLSIDLPDPVAQTSETRALLANFDQVYDLNVVVADPSGNVLETYYFAQYEDGSTPLPITVDESGKGTITISEAAGFTSSAEVYLLANYGQEAKVTTVADLKALRDQNLDSPGMPQECLLFAQATDEGMQGNARHLVGNLKRTVAMVTLQVDGTSLREGVRIEPLSISLHNVPTSCVVGKDNSAAGGNVVKDGDSGDITSWGRLEKGKSIGSNDKDAANFYALFLYENLQPDGTGNDNNRNEVKKPAAEHEAYSTYIEFAGRYTYDNPQGGKTISGTVKYRYYIGKDTKDIHNNFRVERNTHYKLTLTLNDLAAVEGGQLDEEGNLNTDGQGNWRVETDLSDFSYYVPSNIINGCGQYLPIEVTANADCSIKTSVDGASWLWFYDFEKGSDWHSAIEGVNLESGTNLVYLYVQPLDPGVPEYGKKRMATVTLTCAGKTQQFTLTQYAPIEITMPRFNDDGTESGETETFWVEAVDRSALPWGFENEDFADGHTSGAYSMDNMKILYGNYRQQCLDYMPFGLGNGGSAMMVAAWNDCATGGDGAPNIGNPYDVDNVKEHANKIWDYIMNIDHNSWSDRKYLYSVPSIVEWQYIEKAIMGQTADIGPDAEDPNCRLNPAAEYWTSNYAMDFPGESYTYQIERGLDELKRGEDEYIYHRNRKTALRYRLILTKNPNVWW